MASSENNDNEDVATQKSVPVRQFSVFLPNRAGALLSVVRLVNDSMAEVLGISVLDSVDGTVVRLVVSDPESVETLFIEKGIPHSMLELAAVELPDNSHLAKCLATLLEAETNVHFCYPLLCRPNDRPVLAFCLEDTEFGTSVLLNSGFKVLYEADLSR